MDNKQLHPVFENILKNAFPKTENELLCCDYHKEGMEKINAPIILITIRAGHNTCDIRPFQFCPWCGTNIRETT